jgi:hypothetical protein
MTDNSNPRPPRKGQFQPGKSGNPRGRPKGAKNFRTLVLDRLQKKVTVIEQGRARKISMAEAIAIQTVNKASAGDPKAVATILTLTRDHDDAPMNQAMSVLARAEDSLVMNAMIARIRAAPSPECDSSGGGAEVLDDHSSLDANRIDDDPSSTGDA